MWLSATISGTGEVALGCRTQTTISIPDERGPWEERKGKEYEKDLVGEEGTNILGK